MQQPNPSGHATTWSPTTTDTTDSFVVAPTHPLTHFYLSSPYTPLPLGAECGDLADQWPPLTPLLPPPISATATATATATAIASATTATTTGTRTTTAEDSSGTTSPDTPLPSSGSPQQIGVNSNGGSIPPEPNQLGYQPNLGYGQPVLPIRNIVIPGQLVTNYTASSASPPDFQSPLVLPPLPALFLPCDMMPEFTSCLEWKDFQCEKFIKCSLLTTSICELEKTCQCGIISSLAEFKEFHRRVIFLKDPSVAWPFQVLPDLVCLAYFCKVDNSGWKGGASHTKGQTGILMKRYRVKEDYHKDIITMKGQPMCQSVSAVMIFTKVPILTSVPVQLNYAVRNLEDVRDLVLSIMNAESKKHHHKQHNRTHKHRHHTQKS
ncbi:hypothetical protein Pelo_14911 [Pelomyxa schiedti]|nr:hypothetical protein Pelo_14911 [Pelomyxa schiedti]